ncbi:MAG: type IV secretion system protein VirD4 [Arenicella sp.]|jgi:type IV secretion system protein VirD4
MMNNKPQSRESLPFSAIKQAVLVSVCLWGYQQTAPVMSHGAVQWLPMACLIIAGALSFKLIAFGLKRLALTLEWIASHQSTGADGSAHWGTAKDVKPELEPNHQGPFWGRLADKSKQLLFIGFQSVAMCVAPAGAGKGIFTVVPMGLSILASKVFVDFKGELICILKEALEKRGERVIKLNPSGLWSEIIGKSDCYNPVDIVTDNFYRPNGLRDVFDDLREIAEQLLPEPEGNKSGERYWRDGSRGLCISFGLLIDILINGYHASLPSTAQLIENRTQLDRDLRWIVGIDFDGKPDQPMPIEKSDWANLHDPEDLAEFIRVVRARAHGILTQMHGEESKTFGSFISGAQLVLSVFAFGRLAPVMGNSTFSMNDLKDGIVSLFIIADSSRMEVYKHYIGIIQWAALTTMKRHPDKKTLVYFIFDEATNYVISGLNKLMTWARGYGIRLIIIFQSMSEFRSTYSEEAEETLLNEAEIKQFLPGQRSPKTLKLISEELLGNNSIMSASVSLQDSDSGAQENMSEKAKALKTMDQIRRSKNGLLFVRGLPAFETEMLSYGEISPWNVLAGINPFHGVPFKQKRKAKLKVKKPHE